MDYTSCPNCNSVLKEGVFSSNRIMSEKVTESLNVLLNKSVVAYCTKCSDADIPKAQQAYNKVRKDVTEKVSTLLKHVPVITLQHPHNWNYTVVKMVSAQSVTGEGALTEFTSSWNEFFGTQSNRMNQKLKDGEDICISKLRLEALEVGGNSVIGTDIDYAEVGGAKGMLMVCMAGTAIKIKNTEVLGEEIGVLLDDLAENLRKKKRLDTFAPTLGIPA